MRNEEINSVDLAFKKRPHSPENFRIHEDKDVNGPKKLVDFVHAKYRYNQALIQNQGSEHIDASNSGDELYCICREPYDDNDKRPTKKMFQCEGPCQKWVHPSCFGETEENILNFEKNGIPYYCSFCRKDVPPEMLKMLKQKHAERQTMHQQQMQKLNDPEPKSTSASNSAPQREERRDDDAVVFNPE